MRFKKGESGNPAGRPRGISSRDRLRKVIAEDAPGIIDQLVALAKEGDTAAAKLLLDRVLPPLKPVDAPVQLALGADLAASGRAVLSAVGTGKLTPSEAATIMGGIGTLARVVEVDELTRRIEALESKP